MTKQVEIQENIAILLYGMSNNPFTCKGWLDATEVQREQCRKNAHFIMVMLDEKGLVRKVNRELPKDWYNDSGNKLMIEEELKKAGYVAVEPLIEK